MVWEGRHREVPPYPDQWRLFRNRNNRHSFASRALALGESLPMIGKLLGHRKVDTTARYAHLARDSVHESAARIADSIAADILGENWTVHAA